METKWRCTNGEAFIMEGNKDIAKIIYPINTEKDFKKLEEIKSLITNAPEMKVCLEDILTHIESGLINLESSGYIKNNIETILWNL